MIYIPQRIELANGTKCVFLEDYDKLEEKCSNLELQRNEVQEKYDTLAVENMLEVNKLYNQREAAMGVLEEISLYLSSGIGDENTTAQQYKDRILDGIKHLAGQAWEERCKYKKLWKEAEDAKIKAERKRDEVLIELEEYRSIAENIGAEKAVSEKEKAIQQRDELREELKEETKFHHQTHSELVKTACELMNAKMEIDNLQKILSAISLHGR